MTFEKKTTRKTRLIYRKNQWASTCRRIGKELPMVDSHSSVWNEFYEEREQEWLKVEHPLFSSHSSFCTAVCVKYVLCAAVRCHPGPAPTVDTAAGATRTRPGCRVAALGMHWKESTSGENTATGRRPAHPTAHAISVHPHSVLSIGRAPRPSTRWRTRAPMLRADRPSSRATRAS